MTIGGLPSLADADDTAVTLREMAADYAGVHADRISVIAPADAAFAAPLAATLAADAATDPVLFGVLCPGDELASECAHRNRRGSRAAPRRRFSLRRRGRASVPPRASASHSSSRIFPPTCCCPPTISAGRGSPPPRCCGAPMPRRARCCATANTIWYCAAPRQPHPIHHVPKLLAQRGAGIAGYRPHGTRRADQCGVPPRHRG